METPHTGSEFNNIIEQWEENEKKKDSVPERNETATNAPSTNSDLDQLIKQEATEYDHENKENRVLTGDRATVNDDPADNGNDK